MLKKVGIGCLVVGALASGYLAGASRPAAEHAANPVTPPVATAPSAAPTPTAASNDCAVDTNATKFSLGAHGETVLDMTVTCKTPHENMVVSEDFQAQFSAPPGQKSTPNPSASPTPSWYDLGTQSQTVSGANGEKIHLELPVSLCAGSGSGQVVVKINTTDTVNGTQAVTNNSSVTLKPGSGQGCSL